MSACIWNKSSEIGTAFKHPTFFSSKSIQNLPDCTIYLIALNEQLTIELKVLKGLFAEKDFVFNAAFKIPTVMFTADSGLWPLTLRYYYGKLGWAGR